MMQVLISSVLNLRRKAFLHPSKVAHPWLTVPAHYKTSKQLYLRYHLLQAASRETFDTFPGRQAPTYRLGPDQMINTMLIGSARRTSDMVACTLKR